MRSPPPFKEGRFIIIIILVTFLIYCTSFYFQVTPFSDCLTTTHLPPVSGATGSSLVLLRSFDNGGHGS